MTDGHLDPTPDHYRLALGRFVTGVTVVTTRSGGHDHAMTANTFTSVSLEPPLVLVCVEEEARFHDAILDSGEWGVSILGAGRRATADWLSTRGRPLHGQLDRVPHVRGTMTGAALLEGALATLECRTVATHPAGDHTVVLGQVLSVRVPEHPDDALIYYRSRYGSVS